MQIAIPIDLMNKARSCECKTFVYAVTAPCLILWRHDETDHGRSVASGRFQGFDELHSTNEASVSNYRHHLLFDSKYQKLAPTHPLDLPYFYLLLAFIPHRAALCSYAAWETRTADALNIATSCPPAAFSCTWCPAGKGLRKQGNCPGPCLANLR